MNFIGYRHAFAALFAAVVLIGSGGGGSSSATAPSAPLGDAVIQSVGASGGTIDAVTLGAKVHVTFLAWRIKSGAAIRFHTHQHEMTRSIRRFHS
jgi:hypothetical protein